MSVLHFKGPQRPDLFDPFCLAGHVMHQFMAFAYDPNDVLYLDHKGWLSMPTERNFSVDKIIRLEGPMTISGECARCSAQGRARKLYQWMLTFSCGLLTRVQQLPVVELDSDTAVQLEYQSERPLQRLGQRRTAAPASGFSGPDGQDP